jgi:heme exporter protein D
LWGSFIARGQQMIFLWIALALIIGAAVFWIAHQIEEHQTRLENDIKSAEDWQNFRRAMTGYIWSNRE